MSAIWLLASIHGGVCLTMVALAWRDALRLRQWTAEKWEPQAAVGVPLDMVRQSVGGSRALTRGGLSLLVAELRESLLVARTPQHRTACLNEATSEFESQLGFVRVGAVGFRVCMASGVGWGCFMVVEDVTIAAVFFGSGLVGAGLTWNLGRVADSRARSLRERWNGLIRRSTRSFPQSDTFDDRPPTVQCGADEQS